MQIHTVIFNSGVSSEAEMRFKWQWEASHRGELSNCVCSELQSIVMSAIGDYKVRFGFNAEIYENIIISIRRLNTHVFFSFFLIAVLCTRDWGTVLAVKTLLFFVKLVYYKKDADCERTTAQKAITTLHKYSLRRSPSTRARNIVTNINWQRAPLLFLALSSLGNLPYAIKL